MLESDNITGGLSAGASETPSKRTQLPLQAPLTEEQLRTAHVGELTPLNGPIQIADYHRQPGPVAGTRRFDFGAGAGCKTENRHIARGSGLSRRVGLHPGPGGRRLCAAHPRAGLVRASPAEGTRHSYQPACLLARLPGDRPHAALPQLVAEQLVRPSALRAYQAGACASGLEVYAKLRRC